MMMLDFPSTDLAVGQTFPSPPIEGLPVWRWDGERWRRQGGGGEGGGQAVESGTVMLFCQAAAPLGWTKLDTHNDKALRVTNGEGGIAGGTNAFSSVMAQTVVGNHTLSSDQLPYIAVTVGGNVFVYPEGSADWYVPRAQGWVDYIIAAVPTGTIHMASGWSNPIYNTGSISGWNSMTGGSTNTTGGAHNHPIMMDIQYLDLILAEKD